MAGEADSTKERILSAVEKRVLGDGYARLSVDDLTASMGMSKKTFYKVFESKEDMIRQLMDRMMGEVGGTIDKILTARQGFIEKMHALMAYLGTLSQRVDILLAKDVHRQMPELWERIEEFRRRKIHDNLSRLIVQGVQEGYIRQDVNQRIFVLAYAAAIQAVIRPSVLSEESFSASEAMREIVRVFFIGIMTDEGRRVFEQLKNQALTQ